MLKRDNLRAPRSAIRPDSVRVRVSCSNPYSEPDSSNVRQYDILQTAYKINTDKSASRQEIKH